MFRSAFFLFSMFACFHLTAQWKTGDTILIQKLADSVTIHRVDTFTASGLIRTIYYYPNGKVALSGQLTGDSRPYHEYETGEWVRFDTNGVVTSRTKYKNEKVQFYSWHHDSLIDSSCNTGLHRHAYYRFLDGHLIQYSKSRQQWVSAGYRKIIFDMGITSEYSGAESQPLITYYYDSTGQLLSRTRYHRGDERRRTICSDSGITREKYTWRGTKYSSVYTDTNNTTRMRTKYNRRQGHKGYYWLYAVRNSKTFYANGRLKNKNSNRWGIYKSVQRNEQGHKVSRRRNAWFLRTTQNWTSDGRKKMVVRQFDLLFIHYYVSKTWDETTHKKWVTHQKPSYGW